MRPIIYTEMIMIIAIQSFHIALFSELFELSPSNVSGAGTAQSLEHRTRDRKIPCLSPRRTGGIIFFSWVNLLC